MIPQEILKNKDIKAIGKLIIYFLSEQKIEADGGIKTNAKKIADGIGEEQRNVKEHIKKLKKLNILNVKPGKYPIFYLKILIEHYSVPLNDLIVPYSVPLNPATLLNKVVVVLLEKYRFDFGPVTLEKLSRFPVSDQLKAIESTKLKATSNPETYIDRILNNGCKGIKLADNRTKTAYDIARDEQQKFNERMGIDEFKPITKEEIRQMRLNTKCQELPTQ